MVAIKLFFTLVRCSYHRMSMSEVYVTHYGAHHDSATAGQLTAAYHIISSDL